jgi:hypothetical protein
MTINMRTATKRVASNCKRCKTQTTKIKTTMTKKIINSCNQKGGEKKVTIDMKTMTNKVVSSYKRCNHKRCKTQTTKIKITVTKKVTSSCSQKGGKGSPQST